MREVWYESGKGILASTIEFICEIEKEAFPDTMQGIHDCDKPKHLAGIFSCNNVKNLHIIYGKDWYLIYEIPNPKELAILELAKKEACKGEKTAQLQEISKALRILVNTGRKISAELKEDTSYPLYLTYKKRGVIRQIGKEKIYDYGTYSEGHPKKGWSALEQEIFLQNFHKENYKKDCFTMHKVTFVKKKIR